MTPRRRSNSHLSTDVPRRFCRCSRAVDRTSNGRRRMRRWKHERFSPPPVVTSTRLGASAACQRRRSRSRPRVGRRRLYETTEDAGSFWWQENVSYECKRRIMHVEPHIMKENQKYTDSFIIIVYVSLLGVVSPSNS